MKIAEDLRDVGRHHSLLPRVMTHSIGAKKHECSRPCVNAPPEMLMVMRLAEPTRLSHKAWLEA